MMSDNKNKQEKPALTIRAARPDDLLRLADLHFTAYYARFFSKTATDRNGVPYGGPLGVEFPMLEKGQSPESFMDYWMGFLPRTIPGNPRKDAFCFVATCLDEQGDERIIGFVKGYDSGLDQGLRDLLPPEARQIPDQNIGELGSIYIDPNARYGMAGRLLTQQCARYLRSIGKTAMVARAYYKNDSPLFFEKMGAETMPGRCLH